MKYVCIGHATYDTTLPVDKYPIENKKTRLSNKQECGGGPASNAAYLLAKWGCNVGFVGIVGNDYYGQCIMKEFNSIGVNTDYLEKKSGIKTDSSYIISNLENGSRTILTVKEQKIDSLSSQIDISDAKYILLDGEHYLTGLEILEKNSNAISVLDAGRCTEEVIELGKKVNYLVCSKDFAEEFTNTSIDVFNINSLVYVHKTLEDYFKTNVIITLETNGSFVKNNGYKIIPTIPVKTVDSTGAGDIFHGAFVYFLSLGYDLEKVVELSSITSAISVTRIGSRYAIPELSEVLERYRQDDII